MSGHEDYDLHSRYNEGLVSDRLLSVVGPILFL